MSERPSPNVQPELSITRSPGLYNDLVELAGLGIWIFNRDGATSYVNSPMAEMLGYTKEEMEALPVATFAEPDEIRQAADYLRRRKQGVAESHEFRLRRRNGAEFWVYVTSKPIFDRAGGFQGALTMMMDINERKLAEQERDRNYALLKAITDAAQDLIFIKGLDGRIVMVNGAVTALTGGAVEDYLGHHFSEYLPPTLVAQIEARDALVREKGETITTETTLEIGGIERTLQTTRTPRRDETGKIIGVVGIARDISKRKRAEDALRRSEERYRSILETMQEGYYEVDLNGDLILANDALARFFGLTTRQELDGLDLLPFFAASSVERLTAGFRAVRETRQPIPLLELELHCRNGEKRWATVSVSPILTDSGDVAGYRGIARDVTDRALEREALRQSEERHRAIVENIQEGYYEVDLRGTLTFCNDAFLRIYGLARETYAGTNYRDYMDAEMASRVRDVFNQIYRTGQPVQAFEYEIRLRGNGPRTIELSSDLIRDAAGTPIGFRGVTRDITQRVESEKRFHAVFNNAMEGMIVVNDEMRVVDANPAASRLYGVNRDALLDRRMTDFAVPGHEPVVDKLFGKLLDRGALWTVGAIRRADGAIRDIELSAKANFLPGLHLSLSRDITERIRDERLLRAEIEVLEMIAGTRPIQEILDRLTQMVEDVSGSLGGSILLLDPDQDRLWVKASSRRADVRGAEPVCIPIGDRSGSCGAAVRSRRPECSEDIAVDPRWEGSAELLLDRGFRASFSSPIINREGRVLGAFCLLFPEARTPNAWEARFAEALTHLAGIALEKGDAEKRLRDSEARFRAMTEKSADGICLVAPDGKVVYASLAYERILGYKPEEIVGQYAQGRLHPDDAERVVTEGMRLIESPGSSVTLEFRSRHKNDSWRWLEMTITNLLRDPSVRAGVINFRDITQRKLAEAALRASEERFSRAFNLSPCTISIVTVDGGRILQVNDAWVKDSGYSRSELFGRPVRDLDIWADRGRYYEFKKLLKKQGYAREFIADFRMRSGEIRTGLVSAELIELDGERCILTAAMDLTQRLRAEEALRATEKRFSTAFNVGPHPMAIFTLDDPKFVNVNDALLRTMGWAESEVLGRTGGDLNMWVGVEDRNRVFARLLSEGRVDEYEVDLRMRDGRIGHFLISARVFDLAGRGYALAICTDVTERRKAEERLWASETRFTKAFNASPIPISISTLQDDRFINVNDAWLKLMGYAREEVIGHTSEEINFVIPSVDRQELIDRVRREGGVRGLDFELRLRNGERRTFLAAIEILELGGQEVFLVASQDITDRKRMEDELRESRERYKAIFNHSFAGICRSTRDGRILDCNEAMAKMFGYDSVEEFKQVNAWSLHFDRDDRGAAIREVDAAGQFQNLERRMRRKNGEPIWTLSTATLFKSALWPEPILEGVMLDITDRKETEQALSQSRERLRAVSARMETIREEERKAIAREIHDELGQLMTGLKLDIAWIDKRVKATTDENLREQLRPKMIEMASLLETTIQTVRTIASQLRPGALDALGLIAAIQWQAKELAQRSGIRFEMQLGREPQGLSMDRATAVFRIFQEILTNMARHAQATVARIELTEADRALTLVVSDDGIGIPPEKIHDSGSLGLLGMRERVLLLGGAIEIERLSPAGTRVTVRIPIA
ncbi:MAG: PAS domain S-box protein [Blastocatellia bacterium]|nr:PAS domain S-box protein [Blastocatellia bacterium]